MPTTSSAKKRMKQGQVRNEKNRAIKSTIRTQLRKVREAVAANDVAKAETEFVLAAKRLDKAGAARVIHRNRASRIKSRLQHAIKKAKGKA